MIILGNGVFSPRLIQSGASLLFLSIFTVVLVFFSAVATTQAKEKPVKILQGFKHLSKESAECVSCHREKSAGIYDMWGESKHFSANVGCYECHKAKPSDKDAIKHKDFTISDIASLCIHFSAKCFTDVRQLS